MAMRYYCLLGVLLISTAVVGRDHGTTKHMHVRPPIGSMTISNQDAIRQLVAKAGSFWCNACEEVFGFLKNITMEKQTLDDIVEIAKYLCNFTPYVFHEDCIKIADGLPDVIKEFANEYLDPQKVCSEVCAQPTPRVPEHVLEKDGSVN